MTPPVPDPARPQVAEPSTVAGGGFALRDSSLRDAARETVALARQVEQVGAAVAAALAPVGPALVGTDLGRAAADVSSLVVDLLAREARLLDGLGRSMLAAADDYSRTDAAAAAAPAAATGGGGS